MRVRELMMAWMSGVARGLALCLGGFSLVNLVANWRSPEFDPNVWWIDLTPFPALVQDGLLLVGALLMLSFAVRARCRRWRAAATTAALGTLALMTLANAAAFYRILWRGEIHSAAPVPVSLVMTGVLGLILAGVWAHQREAVTPKRAAVGAAMGLGIALWAVGFPLLQIALYGASDYRRKADVILVFGARAYADGSASLALSDRVATACELYHQGLAPVIVMSGGPGDGPFHETQVMARLAIEAGVPEGAIRRDEQGLNTQASIRNAAALAADEGLARVLAVSHSWHLPRIKLAAGRGPLRLYTVPCRETRRLAQTPYLLVREVAGFWKYYAVLILSGAEDDTSRT